MWEIQLYFCVIFSRYIVEIFFIWIDHLTTKKSMVALYVDFLLCRRTMWTQIREETNAGPKNVKNCWILRWLLYYCWQEYFCPQYFCSFHTCNFIPFLIYPDMVLICSSIIKIKKLPSIKFTNKLCWQKG